MQSKSPVKKPTGRTGSVSSRSSTPQSIPISMDSLSVVDLMGLIESRLRSEGASLSVEQIKSIRRKLNRTATMTDTILNDNVAINKLSAEILEMVFERVPAESSSLQRHAWPSEFRKSREIVPLTHVCRRWRAIALNHSALWTSISTGREGQRPPAAHAFLERAGILPVKLHVTNAWSPVAETLLREQTHRLQEVIIRGVVYGYDEHLNLPAPQLRDLTIYCDRDRSQAIGDTSSPGPLLFGGQLPALEYFTFHPRSWMPRNQFTNLTGLCIVGIAGHPTRPEWSVEDFVRLLGGCAQLQELILSDLSGVDLATLCDQPAITLPCLRRLSLGNVGDLPRWLFERVSLPAELAIQLTSLREPQDLIIPELAQLGLVRTLNRLTLPVRRDSSTSTVVASSAVAAIQLSFTSSRLVADELAFIALLPPAALTIKELWVRGNGLSDAQVKQLLESLPHLETLVLSDYGMAVTFLRHLAGDPKKNVRCRRLKTVHFTNIACAQALHRLEGQTSTLFSRKWANAPIKHVIVDIGEGRVHEQVVEFSQGVRRHVNTIDFRVTTSPPRMSLPDIVHSNMDLAYWPSW